MRTDIERNLEAALVLAMALNRTVFEGIEPHHFSGGTGAAFSEVVQVIADKANGTHAFDKMLRDEYGLERKSGERLLDCIVRALSHRAEDRCMMAEDSYSFRLARLVDRMRERREG